jgi:hypothetical protein
MLRRWVLTVFSDTDRDVLRDPRERSAPRRRRARPGPGAPQAGRRPAEQYGTAAGWLSGYLVKYQYSGSRVNIGLYSTLCSLVLAAMIW